MQGVFPVLLILGSYFIGSFPTALIVSRSIAKSDIRLLGDGNMGARNTKHVFGWRAGFIVACVDVLKGALVVFLVRAAGFNLTWQMLAGLIVVLGHDFPVFADFRGGQGMATGIGTLSVLFWQETMIGLIFFGLIYLLTRNFDISAAAGLGLMVYFLVKSTHPFSMVIYTIILLLIIPAKKFWDAHHRFASREKIPHS